MPQQRQPLFIGGASAANVLRSLGAFSTGISSSIRAGAATLVAAMAAAHWLPEACSGANSTALTPDQQRQWRNSQAETTASMGGGSEGPIPAGSCRCTDGSAAVYDMGPRQKTKSQEDGSGEGGGEGAAVPSVVSQQQRRSQPPLSRPVEISYLLPRAARESVEGAASSNSYFGVRPLQFPNRNTAFYWVTTNPLAHVEPNMPYRRFSSHNSQSGNMTSELEEPPRPRMSRSFEPFALQ